MQKMLMFHVINEVQRSSVYVLLGVSLTLIQTLMLILLLKLLRNEVILGLLPVGDDFQNYEEGNFTPASVVVAGAEIELLIGMKNEGEQSVKDNGIRASIHLHYHHVLVQTAESLSFVRCSPLFMEAGI